MAGGRPLWWRIGRGGPADHARDCLGGAACGGGDLDGAAWLREEAGVARGETREVLAVRRGGLGEDELKFGAWRVGRRGGERGGTGGVDEEFAPLVAGLRGDNACGGIGGGGCGGCEGGSGAGGDGDGDGLEGVNWKGVEELVGDDEGGFAWLVLGEEG